MKNMDLKREDFINQYPPLNFMNRLEVKNMWGRKCFHLYVHIPYCVRKCGFCYYKSVAAGNKPVPEEYMDALKKEIINYASMPEIQSKNVRSLYIGGGTPTLLSEAQLESLLSLIKSSFNFTPDFEFCSEARPGKETTLSKIELLKSYGLHRLSLGCQSLDENVLKANSCNHGADEFYETFELARKAGVRTINADLMSGMVDQPLESLMDTIEKVIRLRPENIAIYKMEVYLNNALYKKLRQQSICLISDEEETNHVIKACKKLLGSGYIMANHFSFMTSPEHEHIHRRGLWDGEDMLGIGASSHSCMDSFMFQNESRIDAYIELMKNGENPVTRAHEISKMEEMTQRMVLGLKNLNVDRAAFIDEFGVDALDIFGTPLKMLEREGFITIGDREIVSTFEGAVFADDIVREFYLPEHKELMLAHAKRSEI